MMKKHLILEVKVLMPILALVVLFIIGINIFFLYAERNRLEGLSNIYFTTNLKRMNIALIKYADCHSGKLPNLQNWADALMDNQNLILERDFIGPTFRSSSVFYNKALSDRSISELKGNTVVLFESKGGGDTVGGEDTFYDFASKRTGLKLVTLDGNIYIYHSNSKKLKRLKDRLQVKPDDLIWNN